MIIQLMKTTRIVIGIDYTIRLYCKSCWYL